MRDKIENRKYMREYQREQRRNPSVRKKYNAYQKSLMRNGGHK